MIFIGPTPKWIQNGPCQLQHATATEERCLGEPLERLTLDRHLQIHALPKAEAETGCLAGGTTLGRLAPGTTHLTFDNQTVSFNRIRSIHHLLLNSVSIKNKFSQKRPWDWSLDIPTSDNYNQWHKNIKCQMCASFSQWPENQAKIVQVQHQYFSMQWDPMKLTILLSDQHWSITIMWKQRNMRRVPFTSVHQGTSSLLNSATTTSLKNYREEAITEET
jgi:hypothetical protein